MVDVDGKEIADGGKSWRTGSRTDRATGECHYRNGYTQKIYSDAHYVKEEDDTVPPKYYTPPEKPQRDSREPKEKPVCPKAVKIICLCLVCAIAGGFAGAGIMSRKFGRSLQEVNARLDGLYEEQAEETRFTADTSALSEIYTYASDKVVTIGPMDRAGGIAAMAGSGFVISSEGHIITNCHVVAALAADGADIGVRFNDGSVFRAELSGTEQGNDLAVLKIDRADMVPLDIDDSDFISVGDAVYSVGSALGRDGLCMTSGRISAPVRTVSVDGLDYSVDMFQFDAPVNQGNSGCPLFNEQGRVIGVVTAKYSSAGVEGVAFAIPMNDALSIANDLITRGCVPGRAFLGIETDGEYSPMYSRYYDMPMGAYVSSVQEDSAACNAGLQPGDIIIKLGDREISDADGLNNAVRNYSEGERTTVEFYRNGEIFTGELIFTDTDSAAAGGVPGFRLG